ncbi:MAG: murein L,D-transpeptidase catalytic domain-containing protein [Paracoccaceae bacterium]|uniref:glycoside hydrolase family protein n=1 Tax=Sedimentitalea sp. TaxID=2048915 RepID=UPI003265639C
MQISDDGLMIVKHFEGLYLKAYADPVGVWTIGYGHTGDAAYSGNVISKHEAEDLLREDLRESENFVVRYVDVDLKQHQFDALVSFTFNVGGGALSKSTLRKKLNDGDFESAAAEFPRWNKATVKGKKVVLAGLTRRRSSERFLFEMGQVSFFDGRGIVDPDETEVEASSATNVPTGAPGSGAEFLADRGREAARADEVVLRELGVDARLVFPVERLIELRNDRYPTSRPRYWAVVNFDLHSGKSRLFVLDVVAEEVTSYLCGHGIGSEGPTDDGFANVFSNVSGSNASSLGIYRCAETYHSSKNGYSMKLDGLEDTNSNARSRYIVMHGANYVSKTFVQQFGRVGRSEGCPAVDHAYAKKVIDQLKLGSLLIHWKAP